MSSVDIFFLDEKFLTFSFEFFFQFKNIFLTSFELFLCSIDFCQELTCFLILGVSYNASIDFCQELTRFLKLGVSYSASIDFCQVLTFFSLIKSS